MEMDINDDQIEKVTTTSINPEISKLKLFMEVFSALGGKNKEDVNEDKLLKELFETERFNKKEIKEFINKAMQQGLIYERRSGYYTRV